MTRELEMWAKREGNAACRRAWSKPRVPESGGRGVLPRKRWLARVWDSSSAEHRVVWFPGLTLTWSNPEECPDGSCLSLVFMIINSECLLQMNGGRELWEMWNGSAGRLPAVQQACWRASPEEKEHFYWQIPRWRCLSSCCGFVSRYFFIPLLC